MFTPSKFTCDDCGTSIAAGYNTMPSTWHEEVTDFGAIVHFCEKCYKKRIPSSWRDVFDAMKKGSMHLTSARDAAITYGYKFFLWNGKIFKTINRCSGLLHNYIFACYEEDLK